MDSCEVIKRNIKFQNPPRIGLDTLTYSEKYFDVVHIDTDPDINYKQVKVYSGTFTSEGIAYWRYGMIITYKSDDPTGRIMDVNDFRIWDEQDD